VTRLHGTDGIRGRFATFDGSDEAALLALVEKRVLSERSMRIIGESTGLHLVDAVGESPLVILGWDRRDANPPLVDALESGLFAAGCRTLRIGEVPTPGLHHAVLASAADAGMMITASHNPATDSGAKLFDAGGFKSMPEVEDRISAIAWDLVDGTLAAPQENGGSEASIDGLKLYRSCLKQRFEVFESSFGLNFESTDWTDLIPSQGLLLDCSGGAATEWLADGLSRRGLETTEVSSRLDPINENCGAGGLSPTDVWSISELLMNPQTHRLLWTLAQRLESNDGMAPWQAGQIVAAALDGDGDRCLLIEATETGLAVVDGDRMCDEIMRAYLGNESQPWAMAASIESDLGLTADLARLGQHTAHITAVGDRWLSAALAPEGVLKGTALPASIGTEDSGHLVMPAPYPGRADHWSLVGDGGATLLGCLMARAALQDSDDAGPFASGWKKRVSIQPSERSRWDGSNALADLVQTEAEAWCGFELSRIDVTGEPALLLLQGMDEGRPVSIAVRNSGTEAKTAISIRFSRGIERDGAALAETLVTALGPHLTP
jgi:phosphoglucosamine mutase